MSSRTLLRYGTICEMSRLIENAITPAPYCRGPCRSSGKAPAGGLPARRAALDFGISMMRFIHKCHIDQGAPLMTQYPPPGPVMMAVLTLLDGRYLQCLGVTGAGTFTMFMLALWTCRSRLRLCRLTGSHERTREARIDRTFQGALLHEQHQHRLK
ncbi:MAG: hypothetical protein OXF20_12065 [Gammaproteobacteria bacterium]|nr:hypothetical protein [Gammaproteobacteria bacterium]